MYSKYFSKKCPKHKCIVCNYITEDCKFSSNCTRKTFHLKHNFNCKSKNIIYLVTCAKCSKQYVGQTSTTLSDRINNHLSCIRTNKDTPISLHFNLKDHKISHFKITAIEQVTCKYNKTESLNIKEEYWQHKLQTFHPQGINHLNNKYQ